MLLQRLGYGLNVDLLIFQELKREAMIGNKKI
jgi:hypothetical protein